MNRMLTLAFVLVLSTGLFSCASTGNTDPGVVRDDNGAVPSNNNDQQANNGQQNAPVLNGQKNGQGELSFDPSGLPDTLMTSDNGVVAQLNSMSDIFAFEYGSESYDSTTWTSFEPVPLTLTLDIVRANFIGEFNLIAANATGLSVIATVEPIKGGKVLSMLNLTQKGFGKTSQLKSAKAQFPLKLDIPKGETSAIPVMLYICLDGNGNGSCADERLKNINFYVNQIPTSVVDEREINDELAKIVSADVDATKGAYFATDPGKGIVFYAQDAMLDPLKQRLFDYKAYMKAHGAKFLAADSAGGVDGVIGMVDDMIQSEQAQFVGSETASVGGDESEDVPLEVRIPLFKYQGATLASASGGTEVAGIGSGNEGAGTGTGSELPTGSSGETTSAGEVVTVASSVENTGGVIHCSQVCTCTANGKKLCSPVQGKEELISRCQSDCKCLTSGQSGLVCDRDPRVNGCFVEGTLLDKADGRQTKVEELRKGDLLLSADKAVRKIERIVVGHEKSWVIYLTTALGGDLGVTEEHPMMTGRGLVKAGDLKKSDVLLTAKGTFTSIASIERRWYSKDVYNMVLEGGSGVEKHLISSRGVLTGDLTLQEHLNGIKQQVSSR